MPACFEEETNATKSVGFKPTITIVRFHDLGSADTQWLSVPERKKLLLDARVQAKAWAKKGYDFLLTESFHSASDSAQDKIEAYCQLPQDDYSRGLERYVCREHGLRRDALKKGAVRAIVGEGKKLRGKGLTEEEVETQLADIARRLSLCATRFAHRMGAADAKVIREGEDGSKVNKLLVERSFNGLDKDLKVSQHSEIQEPTLMALHIQQQKQIYIHHGAA